jgi:hypothetical protein
MMIMAESKQHHKPKKEMNIWMMSTLVLIVALCASLFFLFAGSGSTVLSPDDAAEKVNDFINANLVQPGTSASISSVEEVSDFYNVTLSYQENDIPVYVSKDGTYLFVNGIESPIDITEEIPSSEEQTQEQTQEQTPDVVKMDVPEANAFVMSYCPYGLQFLKAYIPVMELLGDKADLEVNFVYYAMHGKTEVDENTRMYCIEKEENDKFTDYMRCFVENDDYEMCMANVGIDTAAIDSCISTADAQYNITGLYNDQSSWLNGRYPYYLVDSGLNTEYGVGGSPTFVLNGETVSVNRAAESIKEAICASFNNPPAECDVALNTATESTGIGPIGSGSGSASDASCS